MIPSFRVTVSCLGLHFNRISYFLRPHTGRVRGNFIWPPESMREAFALLFTSQTAPLKTIIGTCFAVQGLGPLTGSGAEGKDPGDLVIKGLGKRL